MGVDVSTWRARVGMFNQKASQKSLVIFKAHSYSQSPNNDQAGEAIPQNFPSSPKTRFRNTVSMMKGDHKPNSTGPVHKGAAVKIPENATPTPQTRIRDPGTILKGDQRPNSTRPAHRRYIHAAWILLPYVFQLFLLLSLSLIDSPSELRPPSSYPPVLLNPDQNETSPVQLSNVQSLIILMCGDVEVNPGPPRKQSLTDRAKELTKFTVPVEDVDYPEYCSKINVDLTLKRKDQGYLVQMEDIVQTTSAMLNYAGGVITLNPQTANTDKDVDEWVGKIRQQLDLVIPQEVSRCIEIKPQSGHVVMWVRKSWKFITYKLPLYARIDAATVDGDITMISDIDKKPTFVSILAGIQWNQLSHGHQFPLSEGRNLEFKSYVSTCDATSLMDKIINDKKGGEPILIRTLLAFTNTEGGGDAIIGIREDNGAPILEGQKLPVADEAEVQRRFNELMIEGLNGEQRIWPSTPNGSEWSIQFYPLRNCPSNIRHVLIHIRVNQIAGGVLADEPEAYTMTCEGDIRHVPYKEWKKHISLKSNKSVILPLTLQHQSAEHDKDNEEPDVGDIDNELFEKMVKDLKQHRQAISLKNLKSASWTKDKENLQDDLVTMPGVNMDTSVEQVSKSELLRPSCPSTWVPDKKILDRWVKNKHENMKECVKAIAQCHSQDAVVIGTKYFGHLIPRLSLEVPQHHAFNFFVLQGNADVCLWMVFEDCRDIGACKKYANSVIRILRSQFLSYIHQHTDTNYVKPMIRAKVWSIADNCIKYETPVDNTESTVELPVLQKAVAFCFLQGQSHIKNRLGEEYLTALTKDQLSGVLHYPYVNVIVFQGPPGSGKSIIAQHLCEYEARHRNLDRHKILYICPCQPLAEFIKSQKICEVEFTRTKKLVHTIREALKRGILLIIVDDAQLYRCSKGEWSELLKLFKPRDKGLTETHLAIFLDPVYQNFQHDKTENLFQAITAFNLAHPFFHVHVHEALPVVIRNSRDIFSFFKANAEEGSSALTCAHDFQGAGVSVNYTSENFFLRDQNNPVIKITKEIIGHYNFEESFTYQETDITILMDSNGRGEAEKAVEKLMKIFRQFYPEANIQRASILPVRGIMIEELKSFSGLDARVCILVHTGKDTSIMSNPCYKCFVASRGITRLVFLLHGDSVESSFRQLKFSEEQQWRKLTRQLMKCNPENDSTEEWLRTNVPDTESWYKTTMVMRCQQQIKYEDYWALGAWLNRHIPPAWRHDTQFVRAVIGSVCETTIKMKSPSGYEVDPAEMRSFLGLLNCLYGAPETLHLEALDSVYDRFETLELPGNALQEVLYIMWYDGYISRQTILSWYDNMDQTKREASEIEIQEKNLGEQIQERMRARQEVRWWMGDATQLDLFHINTWNDLPHYQRVALNALCQLAVTWQGDECTVDKDLLFYYIPQLFCNTGHGLQLLYAVQCVLHHLQNPPGLAVTVLQAVLTINRPDSDDNPVITSDDWANWMTTEISAYEEGRNLIQQLPVLFHDMIRLFSTEVTLTEINGWISANIPQDQMLDTFIITAVCLINQERDWTLIRDWISHNVPQKMKTKVQNALKPLVIQRCLRMIKPRDYRDLADWVDKHILPSWRQGTQFVRAVIKTVCERTIQSEEFNSEELRCYLGALNCLYGAPEAVQFQALDSVYDHVRHLENPEDFLQKVLILMWSDGYINKQVMLPCFENLEQTKRQACKMEVQGKDLGKQIQERMKARLEVKRWMRAYSTSARCESPCGWYDLPHYQRVALHALCQLAVTWQGDKCTVDRNLLVRYIPPLFCDMRDGVQMLYTVQCVLHHLQNPPGLAVAVLRAVLSISRTDTEDEPVITTTDWDKWRNQQNPAYEEGRDIIQQMGQFLDLIDLVRQGMHQTDINGWICENIPQDQMLDAFIIAAVCLMNRGEEVAPVRDWISQNAPQNMETTIQDTLKPFVILRCQERIKLDDQLRSEWLDLHLRSAWRQDEQFVKAVIGSVLEKTVTRKSASGYEVDSGQLRTYLGVLNCLYGAPEHLQLQALDAVYDHVRTLQHHEKVLQEVLDIMCHDGYISRQVILSWYDNIDQTERETCEIEIQEKDLGELIQEKMRARQEVRRWMRDTTHLGYYWYDYPHYQRVVLHALCHLAVTWQGDKCTVDKDLLFHYIPQLFCDTTDGLQLLYAVQCVLHHLQNPPGLAVDVFQALLTISRPEREHKSLLSNNDWDEWRNSQNPAYEEGRNIIHQGQFLDLIVLVSSEVTLAEMNDWVCKNIPQDQMLDGFILAAVCLISRGEEAALVRDWISQNVPQSKQTAIHDTLKIMTIYRCAQRIESGYYWGLADWLDRHMLPSWRRDAQCVGAFIKVVCERTISLDKIYSTELRVYFGALNFQYGAPEFLQIQALDYMYNCVRNLHVPETVLHDLVDIMWSDGYINRQVILSWFANLEQTSESKLLGILKGSKKDLGEHIQERMRARQEVGGCMQFITAWYDLPHYQRVALSALCKLAVTWQGDKCTVDKDLLFHYIPLLFCETWDGLQLLYAVQCVIYHLQNPPGLAVAVLQAVLSIRRQKSNRTLISNTDWDKWKNTKHPVYEEGRNIIQQLLLDLIVPVCGEMPLTEMNSWICDNIPQDQMLDAFIIAAKCLINRGEKVALVRNWISQNVPQGMGTAVQDTLEQFLDLLDLFNKEVTLTEVNGWICENIPQDQMLDAFIIAAVCLLNRGEGVALVRDWISQNVPQSMGTAVQDSLKSLIIQRCIHRIQSRDYWGLSDWLDGQVLPAWRRDAQFVIAVVKVVYERTIPSDFVGLRTYLSSLNCLYGATEALHLKILDTVVCHVKTLKIPDNVLYKVLKIIWSDGYISRQVILSWFGNMDRPTASTFQEMLAGSEMDLREQIQKRMMGGQEVRRWMGDTTQMSPDFPYYDAWYDSPHYQRVALHALCQLAITWQGDKSTVDKDLLFHYISQCFCHTGDKVQLLYAVQCVLFELRDTPGLAESVLEALVSTKTNTNKPTPVETEPTITKSHLDDWRKTEHPVYEQGREILLLAMRSKI